MVAIRAFYRGALHASFMRDLFTAFHTYTITTWAIAAAVVHPFAPNISVHVSIFAIHNISDLMIFFAMSVTMPLPSATLSVSETTCQIDKAFRSTRWTGIHRCLK